MSRAQPGLIARWRAVIAAFEALHGEGAALRDAAGSLAFLALLAPLGIAAALIMGEPT